MSGLRHFSSLGFVCEMKFSPETVLSLKRMKKEKGMAGWGAGDGVGEEEGKEESL